MSNRIRLVLMLMVFTPLSWASKYDISAAIQINSTHLDKDTVYEKLIEHAGRYFSNPYAFYPNAKANTFLLVSIENGQCVRITSEEDNTGEFDCSGDMDDAIVKALKKNYKKHSRTYEFIEHQKREIKWLDVLDKGVVYMNGEPVQYQSPKGRFMEKSSFKNNIRGMLSNYFADEKTNKPLSFFKTEDLIPAIMSSKDNLLKFERFAIELIDTLPKRKRMWPFTMHQAIDINAPLKIIERIRTKKNSYDEFLDQDGNTPFMHAIWKGNLELAKYLIQRGSNPNLKNHKGIGLIHYAGTVTPFTKSFKILDFALQQGANINDVSKQGVFSLAMAINLNSQFKKPMSGVELVNGFKQRGSMIDLPEKFRSKVYSPLLQAVNYKDYETAKHLIDLGANVEHHPKGKNTPLQIAVINKEPSIVDVLLDAGADPNVIGPDGKSALHYAYPDPTKAINPDERQIINSLITKECDINIRDNSGKTAEQSYQIARNEHLERQREIEYQRQLRQAQMERERQARQEREIRQRAARAKKEKGGFNWGKALAMGAGFLAGGGGHLDSSAQVEAIAGIVTDSQEGVEGVSNTTSALNSATQRYKTENAKLNQGNTGGASSNANSTNSEGYMHHEHTFSCGYGESKSVKVPYKTERQKQLRIELAEASSCNRMEEVDKVMAKCAAEFGHPYCQ